MTFAGFWPLFMRTIPSITSSRPLKATMPERGRSPIKTWPISLTRIGLPSCAVMTVCPMSSRLRYKPRDRTTSDSSPLCMRPPPTLPLLLLRAWLTWSMLTPYFLSRWGSSLIWYSLIAPPKLVMSATPGTVRRTGMICQSWIARTSRCGISFGASTKNLKISPTAVVSGARVGW